MIAQDTIFYNKFKLDCGIKILDSSTPLVMGILNVTPDSFYDGGQYNNIKTVVKQAAKMIHEGVDIIDIGGYSTRPKAKYVNEKEELKRIIPAIRAVRKAFTECVISADTFRSTVAKQAIEAGANIINDISGGTFDKKMFETVGRLNTPYILMHIKGTPGDMQNNPSYTNVTREVKKYFAEKIKALKKAGVKQIIIDPGFGFGKTLKHNYELLQNLSSFKSLKLPILVGISRKSMVNVVLNTKPEHALNGTTTVNTIALLNGANILRVHDIKEAKEIIKIVNFYNTFNQK